MDTNSLSPCLELIDDGIFNHRNYLVRFPNTSLPAWSLSALLEVIPKECEPDIQKSPISGVYFAHCFANGKPYITDDHGNAVCAAYEMMCWLLEQGLIKKGGEQ